MAGKEEMGMRSVAASEEYGGSWIDFDLPAGNTGRGDYWEAFCQKLRAEGYAVTPQPGPANILKVSRGGADAYLYFQGAGAIAWWAFSPGVIDRWSEKAGPIPLYLVVSWHSEGRIETWYRRVRQGEIGPSRLYLNRSDLDQKEFVPYEGRFA